MEPKFEHLLRTEDVKDNPLLDEKNIDALESSKGGFAFPVHKGMRDIDSEEKIESVKGVEVSKLELIKASLESLNRSWQEAIQPIIEEIRQKSELTHKDGKDLVTKADLESEKLIKKLFFDKFGKDNIRIWGEEAAKYDGNEKAQISIRIDPIDGTEAMQFQNKVWGIMIGVYVGPPGQEHQIFGGCFHPELNKVHYSAEGQGVFVSDLDSRQVKEVTPVKDQDNIDNMFVKVWKHSDVEKGDKNWPIIKKELDDKGCRVKTTGSACGDLLEALESGGKRVMIIDGDYNEVDYIPYSYLEKLGYKIFDWDGNKLKADDMSTAGKKVVIIPPGKAGKEILDTVVNFKKK